MCMIVGIYILIFYEIQVFAPSVATALAGVFAISVNKICKIMEIFYLSR